MSENVVYIVVFDAMMIDREHKKKYRDFRNQLIGLGYVQLQESVYMRSESASKSLLTEKIKIRSITPDTISVMMVRVPQHSYESMLLVNQTSPILMNKSNIIII